MTARPDTPSKRRTHAPSDHAPVRPLEDPLEENSRCSGGGNISESEVQEQFVSNLSEFSLSQLSKQFGVSIESLKRLGVGFGEHGFTFPMRSAEGEIVGFRVRPIKGGKYTLAGSRLGLFIPEGVTPGNLTVIAEGESDTPAALMLAFSAIGRPGATAVVQETVSFVSRSLVACPCIIADSKPKDIDGAERLADALLAADVPCRVLVPPEPHGDLREWVNDGLTREQLQQAIEAESIRYPVAWVRGFAMLPNAPLRRGIVARIGPGAFALLCVLRSFDSGNGRIFPDRNLLAVLLGVTTGTIDRYKTTLERGGMLTWRRGRTGRNNEYVPNVGPIDLKKKRSKR